jgi:hypothetical protein
MERLNNTVGALLCTAGLLTAFIFVQTYPTSQLPAVQPSVVLPTVTPRPTVNPWAEAPCGCASDVYDCEDFRDAEGNVSQEGSQICMNYCYDLTGEDVHNLVTDFPNDPYVWSGWSCIEAER